MSLFVCACIYTILLISQIFAAKILFEISKHSSSSFICSKFNDDKL